MDNENVPSIFDYSNNISIINSNIIIVEKQLNEMLNENRFNSPVTMQNFSSMKESSWFLGKVAKQISDFRIAKVKEESQDIKLFEDSLKKFTNMFKTKQETINSGLEVFEAETRKQILEVCTKYLVEQYKEKDLRVEFRIIDISDMTLSKYATKTMSIAKPAKDEIDKRINEKVALQNKVDLRLSNLENICLRAGIEPLTIEHIQGFLFETDERYEIKLKVLIDAEIKRNEAVKLRVETETRKAVKEEKTPFDDCPPPQDSEIIKYAACGSYQEGEQPIQKEIPVISEDGKIEKTLSIKIRVPQKATDEQIISAVIKMIKADTLPIENIEVR